MGTLNTNPYMVIEIIAWAFILYALKCILLIIEDTR